MAKSKITWPSKKSTTWSAITLNETWLKQQNCGFRLYKLYYFTLSSIACTALLVYFIYVFLPVYADVVVLNKNFQNLTVLCSGHNGEKMRLYTQDNFHEQVKWLRNIIVIIIIIIIIILWDHARSTNKNVLKKTHGYTKRYKTSDINPVYTAEMLPLWWITIKGRK